jgi:hypothetical protein
MIVRFGDAKRFLLYLGPAILLVFLVFSFTYSGVEYHDLVDHLRPTKPNGPTGIPAPKTHHELFALSTPDGQAFKIDFAYNQTGNINPNIIPHPVVDDVWLVVAQEGRYDESLPQFYEIGCYASFKGGVLRCNDKPFRLPYAPTINQNKDCKGKYALLMINEGPHDARVFYGPQSMYTMYGSNSHHTCFGQWIQNFPGMIQWTPDLVPPEHFLTGTEVQRPKPYGMIEKNWFIFWDDENQMYAHYDMTPKRIFSKLDLDGSAGPDLAPEAAKKDDQCMKGLMPKLAPKHESIHQATNSLAVTLCNRTDPACLPSETNTFVFTLFHKKTFIDYHSVYEPYAMVFHQKAPFAVHGISQKPLWIHGRGRNAEFDQTEMFYVTSISWKSKELKYHGYLDDDLFLGLGYEDKETRGMDVKAGDVLANLGLCSSIRQKPKAALNAVKRPGWNKPPQATTPVEVKAV